MKKHLVILLSFALFTIAVSGCGNKTDAVETAETEAGTSAAEEVTTDIFIPYYGTWEVKDYQSAAVSTIGTDESEAFRGASVTYQEDAILLNGEDVNAGSFTYEKEGTSYDYDKLTEDYQANLGEWWNNIGEVTRVTVSSDADFFGNQFFMADADTLWIYYEGVFFLAKKDS